MKPEAEQLAGPTNLGEVNMTLRFIEKTFTNGMNSLRDELKALNVKVDSIPSAFVSIKEFTEARSSSQNERADLKERVKELESASIDFKSFIDTLNGKAWAMGILVAICVGIFNLFVARYWR